MSQIAAGSHAHDDSHKHHHGVDVARVLRDDNISFPPGSGKLGLPLLAVGGIAAILALLLGKVGFGNATFRHGLAAYHVGAMMVLAISLGAMFFIMIFQLMNSGWTGSLRRQYENVMSFLPFAFLLAAVTPVVDYFAGGQLFAWMDPAHYDDPILHHKWFYFFGPHGDHEHSGKAFPMMFFARLVLYGVAWTFFSRRLWSLSREQDRTGDRGCTAKMRRLSSWGIVVMALTTAFCAFDLLMSLDYRFFSTIWGVYYFSGSMFACSYIMGLLIAWIRSKNKMEGAATEEHFHDLGKLAFVFTVFWAYIAFSQYFLIWYSNIPEETAYFNFRKYGDPMWKTLSALLVFGHFFFLFFFMISRHVKKNMSLFKFAAFVAIAMHALDIFWIVRPMVYARGDAPQGLAYLIDALGIVGFFLIFVGFIIRKVVSGPLVAVNDPWMRESLSHKNYM